MEFIFLFQYTQQSKSTIFECRNFNKMPLLIDIYCVPTISQELFYTNILVEKQTESLFLQSLLF